MRILVYNDISLAADYRAGNVNALLSLLSWLSTQGQVTVLHTHFKRPERELPPNVDVIWRPDYLNLVVRHLRSKFGRRLPFLRYKDSRFKRRHFSRLLRGGTWDAVVVEYLDNAFLLDAAPIPPGTRRIVDLHDLMSARGDSFRSQGIVTNENLDIDLATELEAIARFDTAICLQASEAAVINEAISRRPAVVTRRNPGVPIDGFIVPAASSRDDAPLRIGFLGTTTEFNVDAARQLLGPRYESEGVEYRIAGSVCGVLPDAAALPNVRLLGRVNDLGTFYAGVDVAANLIRFGSGLKTKNVESLLFGVPVITTTVGAEGLEDFAGQGLYVADDETAWANALRELRLGDNPARNRRQLRERALAAFEPEVVFAALRRELGGFPAARSPS
ncbi:MAG: glycosyltransferase [Burkholderiales bacterium]|uniref:glycosyltransferase n=1 Tax=Roseateles sp. TaxID=1971397 RepID=UPI000FB8DAAF|nr:MAG: glycosyltransferase [Burkholderiales bacterium]